MKNIKYLVLGILLMAAGFAGANLNIDTVWHYFGNGAVFGVGFTFVGRFFIKRANRRFKIFK